ncbi:hypothetical protein H0H87_002605 [Tephrocybe sp. NHM501043]|nr:hypothetical protein H0H87_002605 [Tephrocybe sp. NHM501043]
MGSRLRRDSLSNIEALILAQAVWENGADAWLTVSKVLSSHSLISRPKSFFTAQVCTLLSPPINHKLAEKYYRARFQELREQIAAEEEKYKALVSDIKAIRSGGFDAEITANLTGVPVEPPSSVSETQTPQSIAAEELLEGSDLTGVSVTPGSPQGKTSTPNTPTGSRLQQSESVAVMGSPEAPIILLDDSLPTIVPSPPATVTPAQDDGQQPSKVIGQPLTSISSQSTLSSDTSKAAQDSESDDAKRMLVDPTKSRKEEEEEEEEEDAVAKSISKDRVDTVVPEIKHKEQRAEESSSESPVEETQEVTPIQEEASEMPEDSVPEAEAEVAIDDGESSGEEPLHTRRSTRRRRSTLSPIQPVQTRGKARKQRPESPINTQEESEAEPMEDIEELQGGTPKVEADHDASPAPGRRVQGKRKASFIEGVDSPRDKKRPRDDSEPVEEDDAGTSHGRGRRSIATRTEGHKRFQAVIGMLHSQISQHRNGNIFHNPIKNSEAPDYHEIVKRPMDLKTIKMRVKDGSITNSQEYQRDIMLMFANAMMYNRPGSDVHTMAEDMMVESEDHIKAFRQTEGLVNVRGGRHAGI